jgi:hypothetical protein
MTTIVTEARYYMDTMQRWAFVAAWGDMGQQKVEAQNGGSGVRRHGLRGDVAFHGQQFGFKNPNDLVSYICKKHGISSNNVNRSAGWGELDAFERELQALVDAQ